MELILAAPLKNLCLHVYLCVCMNAGVHAHMCVCVYRDRKLTPSIFLNHSPFCLSRVSHRTWSLPVQLVELTGWHRGPPTGGPYHPCLSFMWVLRMQTLAVTPVQQELHPLSHLSNPDKYIKNHCGKAHSRELNNSSS